MREWWSANRRANPTLFDEELLAARLRLEAAPHAGEAYSHPRVPGVRVLMPRTRYHVDYLVDDAKEQVCILAIWHAVRGQRPPL